MSNSETIKAYCLSGLGVDERAFERLQLDGIEMVHVPWISPLKNEPLEAYALRLYQKERPTPSGIVIGVSFGGMIAQEWAKIQQPSELILISTARDHKTIHPLMRFGAKLGFTRILHPKMAVMCPPLLNYYFGVRDKKDKELLKAIIRDTDPQFLRWAAKALLQWRATFQGNAITIHGTNDKIIRPNQSLNYEAIDGGHFCIVTEGKEISDYLNSKLTRESTEALN